jgi:hypothetical protein
MPSRVNVGDATWDFQMDFDPDYDSTSWRVIRVSGQV